MASSGITAVDKLLGGGYPEKSTVLIEGLSSNEKETIGYEFINSGLDSGDFCLYVTRLTPAQVIGDARSLGIDLDRGTTWMCPEGGKLAFVPNDLPSISFGIKGTLREIGGKKTRVLFDLTSQLLVSNSTDSVYRFLDQLLSDIRRHDAVLLATVQQDMHQPQVLAGLELLFDGVLNAKRVREAETELEVKKMLGVRPTASSALIPLHAIPGKQTSRELSKKRIAVLPFANMSPDPDDEFFADGLTEELIDRLCQLRELEVIARTSVMAYKNKEKKAAEIGDELRVGELVEGSVRKAGNKIRVTAQLIDVKTEGHLWSSRYDSELQDIFAVQGDIAEKITAALKVNLVEAEKEKIVRRPTSVLGAYVAYLNGTYSRYKGSLEGLTKAAEYNSRATELDPNYAEAFAQLAMDHVFLGVFWGEPIVSAFSKASELAAKALELGPDLSEAHYAKSWVSYFYAMDWGAAERESRTAIELKPSYAEPRNSLSWILLALRRNDEALIEARKAVDLDPLGVYSYHVLAHVLAAMGRFDEAILWHTKTVEIADTSYFHSELGFTYFQMGRVTEGLREMEKAAELTDGEYFRASLGYGYAVSGRREDALRIASEMQVSRAKGMARPYDIAMIYAGLGESSKALDLLEEAYEEHSVVHLLLLNVEPVFRNLRAEPRFKALLSKLNLVA